MRSGDLIVGGGEAWRIVQWDDDERKVKLRCIAGKGVDVQVLDVPLSFLDGKTLYRQTSEINDIDADLAVAEVKHYVDVSSLGWNPRLWVEAFLNRYKTGHPVPDSTTLLGWFSWMIAKGEEKALAEIEDEKKQAASARRKKMRAAKIRAKNKRNKMCL